MAGLPGTGLGGLFYMLLVVWIIAREGWLTARGAVRRDRWGRIAGFVAMATSIIGVMALQAFIMREWFDYSLYGEGEGLGGVALVAFVPLVLLVTLLLGAQALRWLMRAHRGTSAPVPVIEQPRERQAV